MAIHVVQMLTKTGITLNHEFMVRRHAFIWPSMYAKVVQFSDHKEDGNIF